MSVRLEELHSVNHVSGTRCKPCDRFTPAGNYRPLKCISKSRIDTGYLATTQTVSSTANPGLDYRFGETRELRETPPAAEGINDRFYAAHRLERTKASVLPVNDSRRRVNRVAHS